MIQLKMGNHVEKYGSDNLVALTLDLGERQSSIQVENSKHIAEILKVKHDVIVFHGYADFCKGKCSWTDKSLEPYNPYVKMPGKAFVQYGITVAYAEINKINIIVKGTNVEDIYSEGLCKDGWLNYPSIQYRDRPVQGAYTPFLNKYNELIDYGMPYFPIKFIAPFAAITKAQEITMLNELDGNVDLLKHSISCQNPSDSNEGCGICPSCVSRIKAFKSIGINDVIKYKTNTFINRI